MNQTPGTLPAPFRLLFALTFIFSVTLNTIAQQPAKPAPESPEAKQQQPTSPSASTPDLERRKLPLYQRNQVTLADINTNVVTDKRVIVMMAALNVAGYDYESGNRPLSAMRQQLREDLKNTPPDLVRRMREYFLKHKKALTDSASVAPYLSLALSMADPPAFSLEVDRDRLPEDVREITDFALLLEEFYRETRFGTLLPKYLKAYQTSELRYASVTAQATGIVLSYLRTEPVLALPPLFVIRPDPTKPASDRKDKTRNKQDGKSTTSEIVQESLRAPMRERRFIVIPDLLNATGAANLRVVRDTYYLLVGPTSAPNEDAVRRGFLRFVIEPLTERLVREVAGIREDLRKLRDLRGENLDREFEDTTAFYLITDSLVRAANERINLLVKIQNGNYADVKAFRQTLAQVEEEAIYNLSQVYERGGVLVFHFYDLMKGFEEVGVDLKDFYGATLTKENINFEREAKRLDEYKTRIASYKKYRDEMAARPAMPETISNADPQTVARLNEADALIKARRYADARTVLESIRKERPDNARALFGLADVTSKQAQSVTDSDRLAEELYAAVGLYRETVLNASPKTEQWLVQRSYVAAAKILEFLGKPGDLADAAAAYELAVKLGEIDGGAYQEAVTGRQRVTEKMKQ